MNNRFQSCFDCRSCVGWQNIASQTYVENTSCHKHVCVWGTLLSYFGFIRQRKEYEERRKIHYTTNGYNESFCSPVHDRLASAFCIFAINKAFMIDSFAPLLLRHLKYTYRGDFSEISSQTGSHTGLLQWEAMCARVWKCAEPQALYPSKSSHSSFHVCGWWIAITGVASMHDGTHCSQRKSCPFLSFWFYL